VQPGLLGIGGAFEQGVQSSLQFRARLMVGATGFPLGDRARAAAQVFGEVPDGQA
jgi:hypothetical protein